jgi:telomerase reverse transcriptase
MVDAASVTEKNERACSMLMIYIFPRQYGLHNVFDSPTDTTRTVQKLQDYTLREEEIFARLPAGNAAKTPKRLRGEPRRLVQRLQVLHARCSYAQMLWHYCPAPSLDSQYVARGARSSHSVSQSQSSASSTQPTRHHRPGPAKKRLGPSSQPAPPPSTLDTEKLLLASTPTAHVSAFCQAVLSKIIPDEFWGGAPDTRAHNKTHVMKHVDAFVRLRQFESMSLHDVVQGLRLADMPWLAPPAGHPTGSQKPSLSDTRKRADIFHELVYYVFDSLLMPLVRGNFYVTESAATRHRLLYFRHDVWRHIAEPAMAALRAGMFDEIKTPDAARILAGRRLGFSQIRLLPKARGVRPVVNLRRRQLQQGPPGGKKRLGPSINSVLAPVHAMLKLERVCRWNPAAVRQRMDDDCSH